MYRLVFILSFLLALPLLVGAAGTQPVTAATNEAFANLRDRVGATQLNGALSVDAFLEQVQATNRMDQILKRAHQVGGPRWLDDSTCQVRVELQGRYIIDELEQAARQSPERSPIPADQLRQRLPELQRRTFAAVGTSIAAAVPAVQPVTWSAPAQRPRVSAIATARLHASERLVEAVRPVRLSNETIGEAMRDFRVHQAVHQWTASRKIRKVEHAPAGDVTIELAVFGEELVRILEQLDLIRPEDANRVLKDVSAALANPNPVQPSFGAAQDQSPPQWVGQTIDAQATEPIERSKLKAALRAEDMAAAKLREQIVSLQYSGTTLAEMANTQPHVRTAIDRAVQHARPTKIDYAPDAVTVRVTLDLADLWSEISR